MNIIQLIQILHASLPEFNFRECSTMLINKRTTNSIIQICAAFTSIRSFAKKHVYENNSFIIYDYDNDFILEGSVQKFRYLLDVNDIYNSACTVLEEICYETN